MQKKIDINCDVGEGIGNEALLMPLISSCNIACGAHAGDIDTIDKALSLAVENKVKIGAHPSYPDRENFGRLTLDISSEALQKSLQEQLLLFKERAELLEVDVHHIKAHGALYNVIAKDREVAKTFIKAVQNTFENIFLYVPFQSEIEKLAKEHQLKIKYEAFADRNYNSDLSLVNRKLENALITNASEAFKHLYFMYRNQKVKTVQGDEVALFADTFCVHGDNKKAEELLQSISKLLAEKDIVIA